jgi:hypothetical protein
MQRVKPWQAIDMRRWVGRCILEIGDGQEYECYWLKLPCYAIKPIYYYMTEGWCQLTLFWHGRDGFSYHWQPLPDNGDGDV